MLPFYIVHCRIQNINLVFFYILKYKFQNKNLYFKLHNPNYNLKNI